MSTALAPAVLAAVLITQLGAPRYRDRAQASHNLYQLSPVVLPFLEAARDHGDLEVSRRSTIILSTYYASVADRLADQAKPSHWPRMPWLDMLPPDYPDRKAIIDFYLQQAQTKVGRKGPPDWPDYRLATHLYVRGLFLEQNRPHEVRRLLDRMAEAERSWLEQNGKKYSPPLEVPR
jgi:hypothetical protein